MKLGPDWALFLLKCVTYSYQYVIYVYILYIYQVLCVSMIFQVASLFNSLAVPEGKLDLCRCSMCNEARKIFGSGMVPSTVNAFNLKHATRLLHLLRPHTPVFLLRFVVGNLYVSLACL